MTRERKQQFCVVEFNFKGKMSGASCFKHRKTAERARKHLLRSGWPTAQVRIERWRRMPTGGYAIRRVRGAR